MANTQDAVDSHNGRNGDFTSTSWPGQVGQHAFLQEKEERRRQAARAKAEIEAHEKRYAIQVPGGETSEQEDNWGSYWLTGTIILSLMLGLLGFNPLIGVALSVALLALCVVVSMLILSATVAWCLLLAVWHIVCWSGRLLR